MCVFQEERGGAFKRFAWPLEKRRNKNRDLLAPPPPPLFRSADSFNESLLTDCVDQQLLLALLCSALLCHSSHAAARQEGGRDGCRSRPPARFLPLLFFFISLPRSLLFNETKSPILSEPSAPEATAGG